MLAELVEPGPDGYLEEGARWNQATAVVNPLCVPEVESKRQKIVPFNLAFNYTQRGPDSELNLTKG
eukprot:10999766-Lingulodinium_polyedra.AAC.1